MFPPRIVGLILSTMIFGAGYVTAQEGSPPQSVQGKMFVSSVVGEVRARGADGRILDLSSSSVIEPEGKVIETFREARGALVFSSGTSLYLDPETRLEIDRYNQDPFVADPSRFDVEPSATRMSARLSSGFLGICTSTPAAGSSMNYTTPHAAVSVRGRMVAIEARNDETRVFLLEGDVTVRAGPDDVLGSVLRSGEMAVIRRGPVGQPGSISISPVPDPEIRELQDKVGAACRAKSTVYFYTPAPGGPESGDGPTIEARPVLQDEPDIRIVVSPDRMPG